jgi:hypothetical protein
MRDFNVVVPADCIASNTQEENDHALDQMMKVLKADIRPSDQIDLESIKRHLRDRVEEPQPKPQAAEFK